MSEHGTRCRYVGGCRCVQCRKANAAYHLLRARRKGVAPQKYGRTLTHGTIYGYNQRCRCDLCRFAWRTYVARRKTERPPLAEGDPRHGTVSAYGNYGCRCEPCKAAQSRKNAERYYGKALA